MAATHVYSRGLSRGYLRTQLREILEHRDLLVLLTQKELKVKYKGTALGFFWSLLNPLLMMVVYTAVFSVIARFPMERYPIFLLAALLPWTAFAGSILGSTTTIVLNGNLVRRVRFPVEFLPLSLVLSNLVNLVPSLGILLLFALVFQQPLGWPLVMIPLLVLLQLIFTTGISLAVSSITVYFRDMEHLASVGMTIWFFGTPILYPLSVFNGKSVGRILELNPLAWLVDSYQRVWHGNTWPRLDFVLGFAAVSLLVLLAGQLLFSRLQGRFAEEV